MTPTFFFSTGRLLYVGPCVDTDRHRHHAHQITASCEGPIEIAIGGTTIQSHGVYIPADCEHAQRGNSAMVASLYVDPHWGAADGFGPDAHAITLPELPTGGPQQWSPASALGLIDALLQASLPERGNVVVRAKDARLEQVLEILRDDPHHPPTPGEISTKLGISVSRFTHLFSAGMGVPYRSYILWQRMQTAIEEVVAGSTLTRASHAAGFSDSAHMSRTFRTMFGLAPSTLLRGATMVRLDGN